MLKERVKLTTTRGYISTYNPDTYKHRKDLISNKPSMSDIVKYDKTDKTDFIQEVKKIEKQCFSWRESKEIQKKAYEVVKPMLKIRVAVDVIYDRIDKKLITDSNGVVLTLSVFRKWAALFRKQMKEDLQKL